VLNLDVSPQWYGGGGKPESAWFWNLYLGFDWY